MMYRHRPVTQAIHSALDPSTVGNCSLNVYLALPSCVLFGIGNQPPFLGEKRDTARSQKELWVIYEPAGVTRCNSTNSSCNT